jgi:hypothetical protein
MVKVFWNRIGHIDKEVTPPAIAALLSVYITLL